jgi:sec-independent protein translocase protein TatC
MIENVKWADVLHEGRRKITRLAILLGIGFGIFWFLSDFIIRRIKIDLLPEEATLIVTGPMEYVMVKIQISIVLGMLFALPFFAVMLLRRFKVKIKGKTTFIMWIFIGIIMFIIGFAFTYLILLPTAINILTTFSVNAGVSAFFSVNQFVLFIFITTIIFSLVFELPVIVSWLAINGFVSIDTLKKKRKHVYVGVFILAAVITADPTIISQVLLSIPLIILYELSIVSAKLFSK